MKSAISFVATALLAAAPAFAQTVILDFETVESFASIGGYYNGQAITPTVLPAPTPSLPGPAWGITFGDDALGLFNDTLGPYFSNAPSPLGVMTVVGPASVMNVALGFSSLGLAYSSLSAVTNAVQVWSGLNGTGSLLGSISLLANAQAGCTDSPLCHFDNTNLSFTGVARSVTFANAANEAAFDNLTVALVPEPASAALMCMGVLGVMGFAARRRG
jgi:hypothetical protein